MRPQPYNYERTIAWQSSLPSPENYLLSSTPIQFTVAVCRAKLQWQSALMRIKMQETVQQSVYVPAMQTDCHS